MSDRTLVAYARDGGWDLHRAPRPPSVSAARPFGGTAGPGLARRVRRLLADRGIDAVAGALVDPPATVVDPRPVGRVRSGEFAAVARACRFDVYDRVYRVSEAFAVTRFLALWLGPPGALPRDATGTDAAGDGALVAFAPDEEGEWTTYTRGWFEGVKTAAWDAVRGGRLDPSGARAYLRGRVREYAGDREVYAPGRAGERDGSD
ncbi:MAG: DUF6735 family protein [Haloarculaceae archaeon]